MKYNRIDTFIAYYWFPYRDLPRPLFKACIRQLSQNWSAFTDGDPASFEVMRTVRLTLILVGEQYGDPATRSQRLSYKAKHKPRSEDDQDSLEGYDSYDPDNLIYPEDDQDDEPPDLSDMWWI